MTLHLVSVAQQGMGIIMAGFDLGGNMLFSVHSCIFGLIRQRRGPFGCFLWAMLKQTRTGYCRGRSIRSIVERTSGAAIINHVSSFDGKKGGGVLGIFPIVILMDDGIHEDFVK